MALIAIIAGTGLSALEGLEITRRESVETPYGDPSAALTHGVLCGREVAFLARHGDRHTIPPHRVNYRANLWALRHAAVERVIAVAAVGGIRGDMTPGSLAFPDQIIDYTWSRAHTLYDGDPSRVAHIDFTEPYCAELRAVLIRCAKQARLDAIGSGTYGATQGPRLETAAEIARMKNDGCDMVGMTGMPEASLARELDLCYATCAVIANRAAGLSAGPITMDIVEANLRAGMAKLRRLLEYAIPVL
jgi:5'-methylthioinosine phosphorylase